MGSWIKALVLAGMVAGVASCGEAQEYLWCRDVCDKYKECVDGSTDVGSCASRCEARSDQDGGYAQRVSRCQACVQDRACVEATTCWNECL